jgi:hypothetical protein
MSCRSAEVMKVQFRLEIHVISIFAVVARVEKIRSLSHVDKFLHNYALHDV